MHGIGAGVAAAGARGGELMNEVEFLPTWYPRRQRIRAGLIIGSLVTIVISLLSGAIFLFN